MGPAVVIVVVLVVVLAAAVAWFVLGRSTSSPSSDIAGDRTRSTIAPAAPMTGLESALDQAMDRAGRNMREKLEAEAPIVDGLKSSDDTGPILRRALDRVEHPGDDAAAAG